MNILVSNFGRQHASRLLLALEQKGWLTAFYTALATEKLPQQVLPQIWQKALRKRAFSGIPIQKIEHFPVLFLLERALRSLLPGISRTTGDWFDRHVASRLEKVRPDLVLTYENTNRETMRTAKRLGIPTVLDLAQIHHDDITAYGRWFMSPEELKEETEVVNPRKAEALQYTDYVLVLSTFAAASMIRHGWPSNRLFTINLGIDPQQFTPKEHYPAEGPLRLLFVGTITRRKGLAILLEACNNLKHLPVELTLIGPMSDGSDLVRENAGRFRYLPFLHHDQLAAHYQEADVFVFPSLLDSWAQTVMESMACGTPVIVTENTGAKDAVYQGGGWVIPANDASALRSCLLHCAANRDEIETKGRQAHAIARLYTWEHYYRQIADALREITRREHLASEL
ncbi:MAG: glycosyltransferase family 4 protein [Saprospirales bacterium]|nr:glycosyltransferase family 4 protein [Saprospirales bacterium]MBK8922240.1 glycosyltransferase family 4 protein [Saprospirales bacterium]